MEDSVVKLDEIIVILLKVLDHNEKLESSSKGFGFELFTKIFEFGLICSKENFPELVKVEKVKNTKVIELLYQNSGWIREFLINFPHAYLTSLYKPETACKLRSGIEFLHDFWGELLYNDKKLKLYWDHLERCLFSIDIMMRRWHPGKRVPERPENLPETHWWFNKEDYSEQKAKLENDLEYEKRLFFKKIKPNEKRV